MTARSLLPCLLALLLPFLAACATLPGMSREEPRDIVVRNLSARDFASATLQSQRSAQNQGSVFGQISPLPRGASQIYGRPTNPPPLPDQLTLVLTEPSGYEHTRDCDLSAVLDQRDNPAIEMALVFEIGRNLEIRVLMEPLQR